MLPREWQVFSGQDTLPYDRLNLEYVELGGVEQLKIDSITHPMQTDIQLS